MVQPILAKHKSAHPGKPKAASVSRCKKRQQDKRRVWKQEPAEHSVLKKAVKDQHQVLHGQKQEIQWLENEFQHAQEQQLPCTQPLATKRDGKTFSTEVRKASYILLNAGVSQGRASDTLKNIAEAFSQPLEGDLPSYRTQNKFNKEMKAVFRQQIREAMLPATDATLKYDGTTKKAGHLVEVDVELKSAGEHKTLLLGV